MNNKTESFKEKLRQALSSTARVISDDLGINPKKDIKNSEKQDLIDTLNEKYDALESTCVEQRSRQTVSDNINHDVEYMVFRQMLYDQMIEDQTSAILLEAMQNPEQRYREMYMP